jgi:hypothetical protein
MRCEIRHFGPCDTVQPGADCSKMLRVGRKWTIRGATKCGLQEIRADMREEGFPHWVAEGDFRSGTP